MIDNSQQKALFIDRDGIINVDHGYVYAIKDFEFSEGIFELLRLFIDAEYKLFIVTNQSGIGRGYYSEPDFHRLTKWMLEELEKRRIKIEKVLYCPHSPENHCHCRKPDTGMIEEALLSYPLDLKHSWMIGDKASDIELAANAGIDNTIYIGEDTPKEASSFSFVSIRQCVHYFQENQGKIRNSQMTKEDSSIE